MDNDGIQPRPPHEPSDGQQHTPPNPTAPPATSFAPPVQYPEDSQALLALILGIIGIIVCGGALSPFGWYLANKDLEAIDAGLRDPSKRDLANAAKIVGIIGTVIFVATVVFGTLGFLIFVGLIFGSVADVNSLGAIVT